MFIKIITDNKITDTADCVEIDLVTSGTGIHNVCGQKIPCRAGDIFILSQGVTHFYDECDGILVKRLCFLPQEYFSGVYAQIGNIQYCHGVFCEGADICCATLDRHTFEKISYLFDSVETEKQNVAIGLNEAVSAYLTLILITVSRYVNGALKYTTDLPCSERELVRSVTRIVEEEFSSKNLTLESVGDALFVGTWHLSRAFKKQMGKTLSDYLREIRLAHACSLLEKSDMTVEAIIDACGLRDIPSFYRAFNTYKGMTPIQYRHKYTTNKGDKIMVVLSEISENLQKGKAKIVKEMVAQAIEEGGSPSQILNEGLLEGMNVIGEKFKNNEVYVPEVLVAARAMNMGLEVLKPHLQASGVEAKGKVCIGTVQGDLHDIGKNIVKMMLEGKGLEVIDLGVDVPAATFVQTAKEQNCQVICLSALLTTTMDVMREVVEEAEKQGIRDSVKIMVGGAPINDDFCKRIGADCYTSDAASAATAAVEFCK